MSPAAFAHLRTYPLSQAAVSVTPLRRLRIQGAFMPVEHAEPRPESAEGVTGFIEELRSLKVWAGNPSLNELQRLSGIPRSTLADALNPARSALPRLEVVQALVRACQVPATEAATWELAWKRIQRAEGDRPAAVPGPDGDEPADRRAAGFGNFLPVDVPDFTGRAAELDRLVTGVAGAAAEDAQVRAQTLLISAIDGMAGVGKTALALHAAHRLADRFPDGQLFLDLHAYTPNQQPMDPLTALDWLLRCVGCPADRIPGTLAERAARWRAEVAHRQVLIVLDNAASAAQLRPLLPGTPGSLVLVTSRNRLTGLEGATGLSLGLLSPADSAALFAHVLGSRAALEPAAIAEVAELCGHLPLALRIAAARLAHRPAWTVEHLAGRLRDRRRRLGELATPDADVAAVFTVSYQHLPADQQRMFRLLGLHPAAEFDAWSAAALYGTDTAEAERLLEALLDGHLLEQRTADRYTFHDLIRAHAHSTAEAEESPDDRLRALHRLVDYYLWTSAIVADLITPARRHIEPAIEHPPLDWPQPAGRAEAMAWLDAERPALIAAVLLAAEHGLHSRTWQLARNLAQYLMTLCRFDDNITIHELALPAALALGDLEAELITAGNLSMPYWQSGDYPKALEHARRSVVLARRLGDRAAEGACLNRVGILCDALGEYRQAVDELQQAVAVLSAAGLRPQQANVLVNLGRSLITLGRYEEAEERLRVAVDCARAGADPRNEGDAMVMLGAAAERLGRPDQALEQLAPAIRIVEEIGCRSSEVEALCATARALRRLGRVTEAVEHVRRALTILRDIGHPSLSAAAHNLLGDLHLDGGRSREAQLEHQRALQLAEPIKDRLESAHAQRGLARALAAQGDAEAARHHHREASTCYSQLDVPEVWQPDGQQPPGSHH